MIKKTFLFICKKLKIAHSALKQLTLLIAAHTAQRPYPATQPLPNFHSFVKLIALTPLIASPAAVGRSRPQQSSEASPLLSEDAHTYVPTSWGLRPWKGGCPARLGRGGISLTLSLLDLSYNR
jgi:hypothetical protein